MIDFLESGKCILFFGMQKTSKAGRAVKLKPEYLTDGSSKKGVMHVYDESDATSHAGLFGFALE